MLTILLQSCGGGMPEAKYIWNLITIKESLEEKFTTMYTLKLDELYMFDFKNNDLSFISCIYG